MKLRGSRKTPFLFLSPRISVFGSQGQSGYTFDVSLNIKKIDEDLVSTKELAPVRKNLRTHSIDVYDVSIRWSLPAPLFTPFDIFRTEIELIAEDLIGHWRASGERIQANSRESFEIALDLLANASAVLGYENFMGVGFESGVTDQQSLERHLALQKLSGRLASKLVSQMEALKASQLIRDDRLKLDVARKGLAAARQKSEAAPLHKRVRVVAIEMSYLDAEDLNYVRLDALAFVNDEQKRRNMMFKVNPQVSGAAIRKKLRIQAGLPVPAQDDSFLDLSGITEEDLRVHSDS